MAVYQISYDLRKQRNYDALYERIKRYEDWRHILESNWVVVTNQSATQIRDNLKAVMDQDDGLFVTRLQGEAAWYGLGQENSIWLKQVLERQAA